MNGNNGYQVIRAIRGPITLITLGVLFALQNFTRFGFDQTWPVLLIVFGLLSLMQRGAAPPPPPPPPYPTAPPPMAPPPPRTYTSTSYSQSPYAGSGTGTTTPPPPTDPSTPQGGTL
jgi:hypothetical protein